MTEENSYQLAARVAHVMGALLLCNTAAFPAFAEQSDDEKATHVTQTAPAEPALQVSMQAQKHSYRVDEPIRFQVQETASSICTSTP